MNDVNYLTVPGAQLTTPEREFLKTQAGLVAGRVKNPVFVTIGVLWAASIWCLKAGAPNATQYGIDIKLDKDMHRREDLSAHFIEGDSRKVWRQFKEEVDSPVHLLFIDGDHHYQTVRQDIAGWTPLVRLGGLVIFHDYAPTDHNLKQFPHIAGVKRAVHEWRASPLGCHWVPVKAPDSTVAFIRRR